MYGLRAVLYLATQPDEGHVPIRRISKDLDISFHFLTKILQQLTQAGLMQSLRGPAGGVALTSPANKITVLDIVEAVEGDNYLKRCVLGLRGCNDRNPCPLHSQWSVERTRIRALFGRTTIDQLKREKCRGILRLAN